MFVNEELCLVSGGFLIFKTWNYILVPGITSVLPAKVIYAVIPSLPTLVHVIAVIRPII
jgi:hypothetical protein